VRTAQQLGKLLEAASGGASQPTYHNKVSGDGDNRGSMEEKLEREAAVQLVLLKGAQSHAVTVREIF